MVRVFLLRNSSHVCLANEFITTESHYITATTSHSGKTKVFDHQKGTYDPAAPRSSDARYEDYQRSKQRERDQERRYREQQRR